jgi:hypothetical protein
MFRVSGFHSSPPFPGRSTNRRRRGAGRRRSATAGAIWPDDRFEALRLELRYDHDRDQATCRITLVGTPSPRSSASRKWSSCRSSAAPAQAAGKTPLTGQADKSRLGK